MDLNYTPIGLYQAQMLEMRDGAGTAVAFGTSFIALVLATRSCFDPNDAWLRMFQRWRERRRQKRMTKMVLWIIRDTIRQLDKMSNEERARLFREVHEKLVSTGELPA